jgi:RimJ/RimL family protein N-acetyltransferase
MTEKGTVSLYRIDPERATPREMARVAELDRCFVEEDSQRLALAEDLEPNEEVWLWIDDADDHAVGFASFGKEPPGVGVWTLHRVWLQPEFRRRGLLSDAWPTFFDHYGDMIGGIPGANRAINASLRHVGRSR